MTFEGSVGLGNVWWGPAARGFRDRMNATQEVLTDRFYDLSSSARWAWGAAAAATAAATTAATMAFANSVFTASNADPAPSSFSFGNFETAPGFESIAIGGSTAASLGNLSSPAAAVGALSAGVTTAALRYFRPGFQDFSKGSEQLEQRSLQMHGPNAVFSGSIDDTAQTDLKNLWLGGVTKHKNGSLEIIGGITKEEYSLRMWKINNPHKHALNENRITQSEYDVKFGEEGDQDPDQVNYEIFLDNPDGTAQDFLDKLRLTGHLTEREYREWSERVLDPSNPREDIDSRDLFAHHLLRQPCTSKDEAKDPDFKITDELKKEGLRYGRFFMECAREELCPDTKWELLPEEQLQKVRETAQEKMMQYTLEILEEGNFIKPLQEGEEHRGPANMKIADNVLKIVFGDATEQQVRAVSGNTRTAANHVQEIFREACDQFFEQEEDDAMQVVQVEEEKISSLEWLRLMHEAQQSVFNLPPVPLKKPDNGQHSSYSLRPFIKQKGSNGEIINQDRSKVNIKSLDDEEFNKIEALGNKLVTPGKELPTPTPTPPPTPATRLTRLTSRTQTPVASKQAHRRGGTQRAVHFGSMPPDGKKRGPK